MVTKNCQLTEPGCRIELRPNQSLSQRDRRLFFGLMVLVSCSIAGWFMAMGAWMVFPFAGLEMLALGAALFSVGRRSRDWEMLELSDDCLKLSRWRGGVAQSWRFQRHWLQVSLVRAHYRGHPKRLLLGSHGRSMEVGRMLAEGEREQLYATLDQAVVMNSRPAA